MSTATTTAAPVPTPLPIAKLLLSVAAGQLGISEEPKNTNWGPDIKKYLASVGIRFAAPWCAAFVYWCASQAFAEAKRTTIPLCKTGGVLDMWNRTPKQYRVPGAPQPGDIFIVDFGGAKGHTGFVTKVEGNRIFTIEGNSNDEGSREGYEVCRKPGGRLISGIKGFIRLV